MEFFVVGVIISNTLPNKGKIIAVSICDDSESAEFPAVVIFEKNSGFALISGFGLN
jgi:hypothetical protein